MKKWYALHTASHAEHVVAEALSQHSIETFLPEISTSTAEQRKIRAPLFPCYLFIYIDLNAGDSVHWQWLPGVRHLVAYGDWPVPLPEEIIHLIRKKVEGLANSIGNGACQFEPGDLVRINDGPFKEMLAVFDGPITPSATVQVLLRGMQNAARLRIRPSALEKVSEPAGSRSEHRRRRTRGRGRYIHYK